MSAMLWWTIPFVSTFAAFLWARHRDLAADAQAGPEPGSPEDAADLARFAAALREPFPPARSGDDPA
ncbi:MAG: hypothetical protein ACOYEV_01800 [Candidatus Nanopelagicales bacterium]